MSLLPATLLFFVIMACNMEDSLFRKIMILNPETASQISLHAQGQFPYAAEAAGTP